MLYVYLTQLFTVSWFLTNYGCKSDSDAVRKKLPSTCGAKYCSLVSQSPLYETWYLLFPLYLYLWLYLKKPTMIILFGLINKGERHKIKRKIHRRWLKYSRKRLKPLVVTVLVCLTNPTYFFVATAYCKECRMSHRYKIYIPLFQTSLYMCLPRTIHRDYIQT